MEDKNLSLRLKAVKETVKKCRKVADIGCDHGYVPIALVSGGIAESAICCDINKGPLTAADYNIKMAGLEGRIETRLSDGLHNITTDDGVDAIVIAGMGGRLMSDILISEKDKLEGVKQMVLQPQSELFLIRKAVRELSFHIESERFLKDMGKYYTVIDVLPGRVEYKEPEYTELYDTYSEYLINSKDELYLEYIRNSIKVNEGYLLNIEEAKRSPLNKKLDELRTVERLMT